jgi:phosphoribosylaminoimidazolecarboxamide formyltransferase/IMP cyclohydrolase
MTESVPAHKGIEAAAPGAVRLRRALLSVSDKSGLIEFARGLVELGIEIVSTGGSARELSAAGLQVRPVEDFTGFPEIMEGRVKTLHPRLYGGLLARRDQQGHLDAAAAHGIEQVDLMCVNLYPFESTIAPRRRQRAAGARDHRHRRTDDDPRGRQESRLRRGGRRPAGLCGRAERAG